MMPVSFARARQVPRPRVHRALGDVVGRHALERVDGRRRVLVLGDRQQAGPVDDAAGVGLAQQQRQERLRGFDQAEHVGVEDVVRQVSATGRDTPLLPSSTRMPALLTVVDLPVALLEPPSSSGDAGRCVDVHRDASTGRPATTGPAQLRQPVLRPAAGEDRVDAEAEPAWRTVSRPVAAGVSVTSAILDAVFMWVSFVGRAMRSHGQTVR